MVILKRGLLAFVITGLIQTCVPGEQRINPQREVLSQSAQLLLVTTKSWNAVDGKLLRFEKTSPDQVWHQVKEEFQVVVGRKGLAWGKGLHGNPAQLAKPTDPIKREGDGRSPAGIFSLSVAFGYASPESAGKVKLPYIQADGKLECVDDSQSAYYNRLLKHSEVANPDWKSSEQMRREDDLYRWGVFVEHNSPDPEPGCGSCIFLHIWKSAGVGTAGCTAMTAGKMVEIIQWLDPGKRPLIVQLPQAEYERLRNNWGLPR